MTKLIAAARRYWFVELILFFVGLVAIDLVCQIGTGETAKLVPDLRGPVWLVGGILLAIVMMAAYRGLVRLFEERDPAELEPRTARLALAGLPLGFLLFALVMEILHLAGVADFARSEVLPNFARSVGVCLGAAVGEELAFRGVLFRIVERRYGSLLGIVISAILFGALHAGNPGAGFFGPVAIALEAGVLLSAAYLACRSLWLPIGMHFAWNFTEGTVFGTAVSGRAPASLIATNLSGPDLLTGGSFGPETSVVAIGVALLASLAFLAICLRRGHWRSLRAPSF